MFAVCQRSLFNASPAESECKGRNFLKNDQMFGRLFLKKVRSGRYRTGNTHFRNGETGGNGREGALLLAALQPHIIYYMPCGMSYTSSPVAGIGFLAKKQAAWREPGGLHEFPQIPIEDLSKAHRRMGEAWGGGIESACLDCLNRSQPDAHAGAGGGKACIRTGGFGGVRIRRDGDAAGGNVVLEECLPFPGAVLYSGGGNGYAP